MARLVPAEDDAIAPRHRRRFVRPRPSPPGRENPQDERWERWTVSCVHGWGRAAFGGRGGVGVYNLQISSAAQIALRPTCAGDLTLNSFFFLYYIASEHCIPVQRKKTTKLSHTRRGLGFGLVVNRTQEAYFAQVSFSFTCCSCVSLSGD